MDVRYTIRYSKRGTGGEGGRGIVEFEIYCRDFVGEIIGDIGDIREHRGHRDIGDIGNRDIGNRKRK